MRLRKRFLALWARIALNMLPIAGEENMNATKTTKRRRMQQQQQRKHECNNNNKENMNATTNKKRWRRISRRKRMLGSYYLKSSLISVRKCSIE